MAIIGDSFDQLSDAERSVIPRPHIGDVVKTYVTPGDPLSENAKSIFELTDLNFLESGFYDTTHPSYPNINGAVCKDMVAYRIIRGSKFDGVNVPMRRFTPSDDLWCGEGLMGDLFPRTDTAKCLHYFEAITAANTEVEKAEITVALNVDPIYPRMEDDDCEVRAFKEENRFE